MDHAMEKSPAGATETLLRMTPAMARSLAGATITLLTMTRATEKDLVGSTTKPFLTAHAIKEVTAP